MTRILNDRKICFISCVNNSRMYQDICLQSVKKLEVPEGVQIEYIVIEDAEFMTEGYQRAMMQSDAKYKIYIHQDTEIIDKSFLNRMIDAFKKHPDFGIAGVVGSRTMPENYVWWGGSLVGAVCDCHVEPGKLEPYVYSLDECNPIEVVALDGLLLMTQYDIPWRTDLFKGWHFYDVSQVREFRRHGYRAMVLPMSKPLVNHHCGDYSGIIKDYRQEQIIFANGAYNMSDNKKVSIIIHKRSNVYYPRCLECINRLIVPDGFELECITVESELFDAKVRNQVLTQVNSKYKVYMDDSVWIIDPNTLVNILDVFSDTKVGMIGAVGAQTIPLNDGWWKSYKTCGKFYYLKDNDFEKKVFSSFDTNITEDVRCIDGFFMATQIDLPWQEEFSGEYFAVLGQCQEFILNNYKIAVLNTIEPWCVYHSVLAYDLDESEKGKYVNKYAEYLNFPRELQIMESCLYKFGYNSRISEGYRLITPEGISIGNDVLINKDAFFMLPYGNYMGTPRIEIGDRCDIGYRCSISAANKIVLEEDVLLAANVHITDHNHNYEDITIPIKDQGISSFDNEVVVGKGSWLGHSAVVVGNVHIGKGCVVAAHAVVTKDIPDYSVVVGAPARIVKMYDKKNDSWVYIKGEDDIKKVLMGRTE